jgi:hypothetical protein
VKHVARSVLCAAFLLVCLSCSTTGSRIEEHQQAFDTWPEHVQQNLRNGVIQVGYTPEMVFIAMGEPSRKVDVVTGEVAAQVWTWSRRRPGVGVSLGGWNAVGPNFGIGSGMSVVESSRRDDVAVVEFRRGVVHRFERLAPR